MWFEDFQDGCHGGHLGYQKETILATLNLHAAPMPSTMFPLHPTYGSKAYNNEDFQDGCHDEYKSDGDVKNVKSYWRT